MSWVLREETDLSTGEKLNVLVYFNTAGEVEAVLNYSVVMELMECLKKMKESPLRGAPSVKIPLIQAVAEPEDPSPVEIKESLPDPRGTGSFTADKVKIHGDSQEGLGETLDDAGIWRWAKIEEEL